MKKFILLLFITQTAANFCFGQQCFRYAFNKKLATNIDNLIQAGVGDSCSVIDFLYPVLIENKDSCFIHFSVEQDCNPVIDLSKLSISADDIEVNIDEKYEVYIYAEKIKNAEISNRIRQLIIEKDQQQLSPKIMFRVDRNCSNKKKIDATINAIHAAYNIEKGNIRFPLIFHLGASSKARNPSFELKIND